jgi:hypothetical protein
METIIEKFLAVSSGSGSGDGSGSGSGYGYGYGDGYGLIAFNGKKIYHIDGVPTIIYSVKGNIAKCAIVNNDLTLHDCYVAKSVNSFAHGDTVKKALADVRNKHLQNTPVEERIKLFNEKFENGMKYPATEFYDWHSILTGSCQAGKDSFIRNNNIDMNGSFTTAEFCALVKNAYGSDVIKQLLT